MNPLQRILLTKPICRALATVLLLSCSLHVCSQPGYFEDVLAKRFFSDPEWTFEKFCPVSASIVARRVLEDYGSMFAAHDSILVPPNCIQDGEAAVIRYQKGLKTSAYDIGGARIELQQSAAESLHKAIEEASAQGLSITPLDGAIAGRRSYGDTLMLWNSRYFPALDFWIMRGRLSESDRDAINRLDLQRKIEKVLEWESQGIYFSTNRTRSIFTSTAPPGTSQHLALVAFDVVEYWNSDVRLILNRNGWFQTIIDDAPHFTYLGFPETELPGRGLRAVAKGGVIFWVPNLRVSRFD